MTRSKLRVLVSAVCALSITAILIVTEAARAQQQRPSSFSPVIEEPFETVRARDKAAKPRVMAEHQRLLEERYDLSRRVDEGVRMTRGKPIPVGPTAKLKGGMTWDQLGRMTPDAIKAQDAFPYLPLPHVSHPVGGMVFPQAEIKLLPRVERFDMDFDLPEHFLPEFPPAMFLTTRKDLGDVSKGQLITVNNFYELFNGILNPKQLEGFTEFEQRAAYFDGDIVLATKKGVNILERASQVHFMSEFQALLDFPPAPKLNVLGRLDRSKATQSEIRGEDLFFGKANCSVCHTPPYYTDNLMHDLVVESFYKPRMEGSMMITAQGAIKTFPLRGIKESPPYLHDGRLLTLEDTVEFFNLVLELKLTAQEKKDLVAFMRVL